MKRPAAELHAQIVWPVAAILGEGPVWVAGALWFVDIKQGRLHRLAGDLRETFDVGGRPSFIVPADGGLIVGDGNRLRRFTDGAMGEDLATIDMAVHNRTNDATVDPAGRLWFGTMDDGESAATGRIYRFDGTEIVKAGGACTITNGPAVSPDGRTLYHVDTLSGQIWQANISGDAATLDSRPFVSIDPADGNPDGVSVDSDGCVWVGLWGGWCARRYAPDGTLLATVYVPCANVTKVAFGGADLRTGYITTARAGLSDAELAEQPLAGGLFAFVAPVAGLATNAVKIG